MPGSALVRSEFVARMARELKANEHKGDWRSWKPRPLDILAELNWHLLKLAYALGEAAEIGELNSQKIGEYAADVANLAMKVDEVYGAQNSPHVSREAC